MEVNFFNFFSSVNIINFFFKAGAIVLALIYCLYAFIVSKNVKIMVRTLEDNFNYLVILITSLQLAAGLILLIFAIFFN
jgi:hypothetical protein